MVTFDTSRKGSAASVVTESFCEEFRTVFPESEYDFDKVKNVNVMVFPMWKHDSGAVVRLEVVKEKEQDVRLWTSLYLDARDVRAFTRWLCPNRSDPVTP